MAFFFSNVKHFINTAKQTNKQVNCKCKCERKQNCPTAIFVIFMVLCRDRAKTLTFRNLFIWKVHMWIIIIACKITFLAWVFQNRFSLQLSVVFAVFSSTDCHVCIYHSSFNWCQYKAKFLSHLTFDYQCKFFLPFHLKSYFYFQGGFTFWVPYLAACLEKHSFHSFKSFIWHEFCIY